MSLEDEGEAWCAGGSGSLAIAVSSCSRDWNVQAPESRFENQFVCLMCSGMCRCLLMFVVLDVVDVFAEVFCAFAFFGSGWCIVFQVVMSKWASPSASGGVVGDGGLLAFGFDFALVSVDLAGGRLVIVR